MFCQTRQKLKEAYDLHFAATIERAEKQIILAKYGRRLLNYLDDTPVVPGDVRQPFAHPNDARQVLNDAEQELQAWQPNLEPIHSSAGGLGTNLMPNDDVTTAGHTTRSEMQESVISEPPAATQNASTEKEGTHLSEATLA